MNPRHSNSVILIWRLAEAEARRLHAIEIEPVHLWLGLSKIVDLDLGAFVPKETPKRNEVVEALLSEVGRLREVFRAAELDPKVFRRRLRQSIHAGRFSADPSTRLHRNDSAKAVFRDAEGFAALAGGLTLPVHLLHAVLMAKDQIHEGLFRELDVDKRRLERLTKASLLSSGIQRQRPLDERRRSLN